MGYSWRWVLIVIVEVSSCQLAVGKDFILDVEGAPQE